MFLDTQARYPLFLASVKAGLEDCMSTTTTSCYLSQPLFHLLIFWGVGFELLYCGFLRTLMLQTTYSVMHLLQSLGFHSIGEISVNKFV